MPSRFTFADTLDSFIKRHRYSSRTLADLSGVSERTIEKWRAGEVAHPQIVDGLLKVATALRLEADEATALLNEAGYPSITELLEQAHRDADEHLLKLLKYWNMPGSPPSSESPAIDTIVQRLMDILHPMPLTYRAAAQRLVEDYRSVFGGRTAELSTLNDFLRQSDKPYALLLAPTGRGKTALLVHWVAQVQAIGAWNVVFIPISIRYQTASQEITLSAIAYALATFYGETEQLRLYNQTPDQLRALVSEYLRRPSPDGRRLLLVLDGLDEAVGWSLSRDLFPRSPKGHLRIIASARQLANTTRADWLEQLGWQAAQTVNLTLEGLSAEAVSDVLQRMEDLSSQLTRDVKLHYEINRVSEGDPLTIRLLAEALRDGVLSPSNLTQLPPGIETFMRGWLTELEQQSGQNQAVYMLLACCAAAFGPLTTEDLQQLAPEFFQQKVHLRRAAAIVGRFIIGDGSTESGYVFSHSRLRELFIEEILSQEEQRAVQARFLHYGHSWYIDRKQRPTAYLRHFWITHLVQMKVWDLVTSVLTDIELIDGQYQQRWARSRYEAEGSYVGYLNDLSLLWGWAEAHIHMPVFLRCAMIYASIRSLISNLGARLLVGLVKVGTTQGRWSMAAALEHIQQMPGSRSQASVLEALVNSGCEFSLEQALRVARSIVEQRERALALIAILPHLANNQKPAVHAEATETIQKIEPDMRRFEALTKLLAHTPLDWQDKISELSAEGLALSHTLPHPLERAKAILQLVTYLPRSQIDEISSKLLPLARSTSSTHGWDMCKKAHILITLAGYMPPVDQEAIYNEALTALLNCDLRDQSWEEILVLMAERLPIPMLPRFLASLYSLQQPKGPYAEAMVALAARLPSDERTEILVKALALARNISPGLPRLNALAVLIPHLSGVEQGQVRLEALTASRQIDDTDTRIRALLALAPCLDAPEQARIYTEAFANAMLRGIADESDRAELLTEITHHVSAAHIAEVYDKALLTAGAIAEDEDVHSRLAQYLSHGADWLVNLEVKVPILPPDMLAEKLALARSLPAKSWRVRHLIGLASQVPMDQRLDIHQEALTLTLSVPGGYFQVALLQLLAPQLSSPVMRQAFEAIRVIANNRENGTAYQMFKNSLAVLTPYMPEDLFEDALNSVLKIPDHLYDWRLEALYSLSSRLSSCNDIDKLNTILDAICRPGRANIFVYEAAVMSAIASHLPANLLTKALAIARRYPEGRTRSLSLMALAPHLPDEQSLVVYLESIDAAITIDSEEIRSLTLEALCQGLPITHLMRIHNVIRQIGDQAAQVKVLLSLASRLTGNEQQQVYGEALAAAQSITNSGAGHRVRALLSLAPHLTGNNRQQVYKEALASAQSVDDFTQTMIEFGGHLNGTEQEEAYYKALRAARSEQDVVRTQLLTILAPHLAAWTDQSAAAGYAALKLYLESVKTLAADERGDFLNDIRVLMVWLAKMVESRELEEIASAVIDVGHAWP